jgi:Putative metal-binding motif
MPLITAVVAEGKYGEWQELRYLGVMGVVSWVARLSCVVLLAACRTESGHSALRDSGSSGAPSSDAGVVIDAGDFVTDYGSHFRSKAECLADTDGYIERLDRDGDGRSATWRNYCNDYTQLRTADSEGEDCDDTDPSVAQYSWRDADGDGATVGDSRCGADVPTGYSAQPSRMPDCNDNDPELSQNLYTDADGDGFGSPDSPTCVAPLALDAAPPPGLSLNQADCDDAAADVHPGAFELWNDSVDSNCDGNDDPLACGEAGRSCGCDLLATSTVPIVTSCAGSDLFIAAQETCTTCLGRTVVVIGNRGTEGASRVSFTVDGQAFPSLGALAPGSLTLPIVLPSGAAQLQLTALPNGCNPADDLQGLESSAGICDP